MSAVVRQALHPTRLSIIEDLNERISWRRESPSAWRQLGSFAHPSPLATMRWKISPGLSEPPPFNRHTDGLQLSSPARPWWKDPVHNFASNIQDFLSGVWILYWQVTPCLVGGTAFSVMSLKKLTPSLPPPPTQKAWPFWHPHETSSIRLQKEQQGQVPTWQGPEKRGI